MRGFRPLVAGCAGAGLVLTMMTGLGWSAGAQAQSPRVPAMCSTEVNSSRIHGADTRRLATEGIVILDGRTVRVTGPGGSWRAVDANDNTFNNRFHGMEWIVPYALAGGDAVTKVLERELELPDPGSGTTAAELRATGWTTGAIRLRQGVVNCLYLLTSDERLRPIVEGLVDANMDPARYRGRPLRKPHNLGTLANHVLIESADVFERPEWRTAALIRFKADADSVFTNCGMSAEQSTTYHRLNVNTWQRALRTLRSAELVNPLSITDRIDQAELALLRLARPDGVLEAIGDSNEINLAAPLQALDDTSIPTRLWCTSRGWAANRTAWQGIVDDDSVIQYTLRFGPSRRAHGHDDHGSMTWFARGVPVLSDRGLFDKASSDRNRWASSYSAHSTFQPVGRSMRTTTRARIQPAPPGIDSYRLSTERAGISRTREVEVSLQDPVLRVKDAGSSSHVQQWLQHWHLAPAWQPVAGASFADPIAVHPRGLWLYAACHDGITMRPSVSTVESFPLRRKAVPAMHLRCGTMAEQVSMESILVVSDVQGRLSWDRRTGAYAVTTAEVTTTEVTTAEVTPAE
jgi:hypothetical protein